MPLEVRRLRDSGIASAVGKNAGEEFRAAVLLWCAAWHQVPAGSLPDDEASLASAAGYGRSVREWKTVRTGALRGWVKCTDGRLYHEIVAIKANESWQSKLKYSYGKFVDRVRKDMKLHPEKWKNSTGIITFEDWNERRKQGQFPADSVPLSAGNPPEKPLKVIGSVSIKPMVVETTTVPIATPPPDSKVKTSGQYAPEGQGQKPWHSTESGIVSKGKSIGLDAKPGESMMQYKSRIFEEIASQERRQQA